MDRAACHGSEHPPPPPDRPLAARGPGRKPWHILGENGWRILTENLHAGRKPLYEAPHSDAKSTALPQQSGLRKTADGAPVGGPSAVPMGSNRDAREQPALRVAA